MSILYLDQTGQLGGGELSLFDYLEFRGEKSRIVLFEDGPFREALERIGMTVEIVPLNALKGVRRGSGLGGALRALPALWRLRHDLAKVSASADILYANSQKAFLLAALIKHRRQGLLWHLRDILTGDHFSTVLRKVAVFMGNRRADLVAANSQATADAFVNSGGKRDKVRFVPDGVNPALFDCVDRAQCAVLRKEICPENVHLLGLFGRLAEWKGQHVLLEAIVDIPEVHVCLVGEALFGEQAYAEALRTRAAKPDLAGRVHFLGFRRDIAELMTAMDVVVHASTAAEPLGRVIIEGMLARKPVIATRAGGAMEIVEDGVSGVLVAPDSVSELAEAIRRYEREPMFAAQMARNGRIRAESTFSLEVMVRRMESVLQEMEAGLHRS